MLPLFQLHATTFYSLQLAAGASALDGAGLIDLTPHITDFADSAALMAELDLIISVDTAIVHLAGGLGHPVWNLLTLVPHWPWGLKGETTPWYPTMRLFRQTKAGEWDPLVLSVVEALEPLSLPRPDQER